MGAQTAIEWTDHTFNPWIGCTKVGPGCDHCYAEKDFDIRRKVVKWGAGNPRHRTGADNWKQPLRWNAKAENLQRAWDAGLAMVGGDEAELLLRGFVKPQRPRVFCASLADWLDNEVPIEWLVELLDLIRRTPHLDWLLLTKRIGNWKTGLAMAMGSAMAKGLEETAQWIADWLSGDPPRNVWMLATIVNQTEADRDIAKLLAIPARVRGLSIEPMLGPVDLWRDGDGGLAGGHPTTADIDGIRGLHYLRHGTPRIHWVICGGESGPKARPMHPDWARSLRDQCAAAGVPFLFKQWGEWHQYVNEDHYCHDGEEKRPHAWVDRDSGDWGHCWLIDDDGTWSNYTGDPPMHEDGQVLERIAVVGWHGKKAAGRKLDGIERNAFPVVRQ